MTQLLRRQRSVLTRFAHASDLGVILLAWILEMWVWWGERDLRFGGQAPIWVVPVCSALVFATLLGRRRLPVQAFAVQVVWATVMVGAIPGYYSFAGVLVALYALAAYRRPTVSLIALACCVVPFGIQTEGGADFPLWLVDLAIAMIAASAAWRLGTNLQTARAAAERTAAAETALRNERLRIARELHDIVAHSVSVIMVQAAGAKAMLTADPSRSRTALDAIVDVGGQAMSELRRLLCLLRSAGGDDTTELDRQPGIDDLDDLLDKAGAADLAITIETTGDPCPLDPSVSLTAYRLVQEALTNIMKHAGPGAFVHIEFVWGYDRLTISVNDRADGAGTATPHRSRHGLSTGHGLLGLRERVTTVGGSFDAHPVPGGFTVRAVLPVARQAPAPAVAPASQPMDRVTT